MFLVVSIRIEDRSDTYFGVNLETPLRVLGDLLIFRGKFTGTARQIYSLLLQKSDFGIFESSKLKIRGGIYCQLFSFGMDCCKLFF